MHSPSARCGYAFGDVALRKQRPAGGSHWEEPISPYEQSLDDQRHKQKERPTREEEVRGSCQLRHQLVPEQFEGRMIHLPNSLDKQHGFSAVELLEVSRTGVKLAEVVRSVDHLDDLCQRGHGGKVAAIHGFPFFAGEGQALAWVREFLNQIPQWLGL